MNGNGRFHLKCKNELVQVQEQESKIFRFLRLSFYAYLVFIHTCECHYCACPYAYFLELKQWIEH